jgi:hypothetical protein
VGPEEHSQNGVGGIIGGMEETAGRVIRTEPVVRAAIPLDQQAQDRSAGASLAVERRPASTLGLDPFLSPPAADRFPADPKVLPLSQHFDEVGVVELVVTVLGESQDPLADLWAVGIGGSPTPAPMGQALGPFLQEPGPKALGVPIAKGHELSPSLQRQGPVRDPLQDRRTLHFMTAQGNPLLHVRLLPERDILAWQLRGTFMLGYHKGGFFHCLGLIFLI